MSKQVHLVTKEDQPSSKFKVESLRILKKPIIFTKPIVQQDSYDILEDLWSILANITYGQLFQNPEYKVQIVKVFKEDLESV